MHRFCYYYYLVSVQIHVFATKANPVATSEIRKRWGKKGFSKNWLLKVFIQNMYTFVVCVCVRIHVCTRYCDRKVCLTTFFYVFFSHNSISVYFCKTTSRAFRIKMEWPCLNGYDKLTYQWRAYSQKPCIPRVGVCVCVCVQQNQRERERQWRQSTM